MARAKARSKKPGKPAKAAAKPSGGRTNKPIATRKRPKIAAGKAGAKRSPRASSPPETARTRAPTISVRDETPRTRAPTASPRPVHRTVLEPGNALADPARAAELAALEAQAETLGDPDLLVALATQIDALGMQLAYEISRHAHDEAHIAPLKPVLMRVPALYGRTLLRAAEKFDDQGSPRRAAYVMFEALRKAFDHDVITSVAGALSFVLEAHGQSTPAAKIRALLADRDDQRARGVDRREVRTQFAAALDALRDGGVQWDALDDVADTFD